MTFGIPPPVLVGAGAIVGAVVVGFGSGPPSFAVVGTFGIAVVALGALPTGGALAIAGAALADPLAAGAPPAPADAAWVVAAVVGAAVVVVVGEGCGGRAEVGCAG